MINKLRFLECLFSNSKDILSYFFNLLKKDTAAEIADKMPPDYYAGNKALYVTALQNQLAIFSPDGAMPEDPCEW